MIASGALIDRPFAAGRVQAKGDYMAGSEAQAGFYYQNIVAAQYALELIEFGSRHRSLTLENPERAKHIDDIIIDGVGGAAFIQVKWSQDDTSAFTLHNLVAAEDDSTSLLAKLARGFRQVSHEDGKKEILLLSNRRAGTNRQPRMGFDRSLKEFIDEFHQPFVDASELTKIQQVATFDEYKPILKHLLEASGLCDFVELSGFLKCLRFRLNQPDRDTMADRVRSHLARLGIEQGQYATLLDEVVNWSLAGKAVQREDVLRVLGLRDRFVDRVSHYFPVDRTVWVPTPELFSSLDSSIGTIENGFLLLEGEPGCGKSTALTMYLSERPDVRFGYYCFVPNERTLGNERLGEDAFVRSICIGLKNAFPDVQFPRPYALHTVELLNEWLRTLSTAKKRVVFVVDGLDHVDRKSRQSLVARPLTSVLDGELPQNVVIVLSSRYPEALPTSILEHVRRDKKRHIQMSRFSRNQVREFFRLRGVGIADELIDAATEVSGGVPIYLEYLADRLGEMNSYQQEQYLKSVPTLRDDRIDVYHQHLWGICEKDEKLLYILAILAAREEFTTPETLRELLQSVGAGATLGAVHEALKQLRHVLRVSDANSVAIRHSSLAEFVSERTEALRIEITRAMLDWYDQHPDADEAWRHRFRHLFHAGRHAEILAGCDDTWLARAWANHRPIPEIQRNLDIAWHVASINRDVLEFVRIGLMKQRMALVATNLDLSEARYAQLLLDMGRPDEALRRVWNGERRQCGSVEFADFSLSHLASTGRPPAADILIAGLGEGPDLGASFGACKTWYQMRSHSAAAIDLLLDIGRIRWRTEPSHEHVREPFDENKNRRHNLDLQLAVVCELSKQPNLDALERVRDSDSLPDVVRVAARAACSLILARAGQKSDAILELKGLELSPVPESYREWLILELATHGLDGHLSPLVNVSPPHLPTTLLDSRDYELSERLFCLYDDLRVFFLRDSTGFPWFEAATTGLVEPIRTVISSLGRLARLWTCWVRKSQLGTSPVEHLKGIIVDLDLDPQLFVTLDQRGDYAKDLYHRSAHRFYEQVWSCSTSVLSETEIEELARWWARTEEGERALRFPEATRSLAVTVHAQLEDRGNALLRELLVLAERSERADEETTAIAPGLVACASAWGRCGFSAEGQRLWCALLDVACGVYYRKDYQFNEILSALELAHHQDPDGTLDRVMDQMTLAHQLVGTSRSKTVAVAIEDLIKFVSRIEPRLALTALVREEDLIFRARALHNVVLALLENSFVDRRFVLSLVATMGRWENYREFDEHTKPAMLAVYSAALRQKDYATARKAYDLWRQILLVEKEMPDEVQRMAALWIQAGSAPPDVLRDYSLCPPPDEKAPSGPADSAQSSEDECLSKELQELAYIDMGKLEARLDDVLQEQVRRDRRRDLERVHDHWRNALGQAAARTWSEEDGRVFDECFERFGDAAIEAHAAKGTAGREAVRDALGRFVGAVSEKLACSVTVEQVEEFFDVDGWLDTFVRAGTAPYLFDRKIEERLPAWIAAAPLGKMETWEGFCRRRCSGETKAAGFLALAERRATTDPNRAIENLVEAWESESEFFHEHGPLQHHICSKLLELDPEKGCELLFESFRQQYQRFPGMIIYRLDNLLKFASRLPKFDATRLYDIWASHNRHLAAGLSEKPTDLSWLKQQAHSGFQDACLNYLLTLLDYPVVDVRLLALDELFRLLQEREDLSDAILKGWPALHDGQKEYVATLLFSLGIARPASAERWVPQFIALVQKESHYNLRVTAADAVQAAADRCANIGPRTVADARALKYPPRIALAQLSLIRAGSARGVRFPPYLQWSTDMLSDIAAPGELNARTLEMLSRLYPQPERGIYEETAVHRSYNINTNFDTIEIGGEYDLAVRTALNRAIQALVDSCSVSLGALRNTEDVLRLRDPTDVLVGRISRPDEISWIDGQLTDEEFTGFMDIDKLSTGYSLRDGEWVTLYEHTEQRTGERLGSNPQRAHKVNVTIFGISRGGTHPTLKEVADETETGTLSRFRNLYRFELTVADAPTSLTTIVPLLVISGRAFRGRPACKLAALVRELAEGFSLSQDHDDPFGYVIGGEKVVRSIEWQEAFDQGRRRHEPRSSGFLLQMKRELLRTIPMARSIELWAYFRAQRSTDRYKPEHEMNWHSYENVLPIRLM
jgi:hypothetical protein